jgi:hypothetical protein
MISERRLFHAVLRASPVAGVAGTLHLPLWTCGHVTLMFGRRFSRIIVAILEPAFDGFVTSGTPVHPIIVRVMSSSRPVHHFGFPFVQEPSQPGASADCCSLIARDCLRFFSANNVPVRKVIFEPRHFTNTRETDVMTKSLLLQYEAILVSKYTKTNLANTNLLLSQLNVECGILVRLKRSRDHMFKTIMKNTFKFAAIGAVVAAVCYAIGVDAETARQSSDW